MKNWKTAALVAAMTAAIGLGAAFAPAAHGQSATVVAPGHPGVIPRVINDVFSLGGGSRLGVSVRDVAADAVKSGQPAGVSIDEVTEGSAAEKAGVLKGDVVIEFDGERVRSVRQFTRLVQESVAGRAVAMTVLRDGQRRDLTVSPEEARPFRRLGEDFQVLSDSLRARVTPRPPAPPAPPSAPRPPAPPQVWEFPELETFIWRGTGSLGVTITELSPQLAEYFGVTEGVLVSSVAEDSAAARAGIKAGDVVTTFNGTTVARAAELRREMQRARPGEEFTISVVREKNRLTLKGKAEERREVRRAIVM